MWPLTPTWSCPASYGRARHAGSSALRAARRITLFTSPVLLAELQDVLSRPKSARRLARAGVAAATLVRGLPLAGRARATGQRSLQWSWPDFRTMTGRFACAGPHGASTGDCLGDSHLLQLASTQASPSGRRRNCWRPCRTNSACPVVALHQSKTCRRRSSSATKVAVTTVSAQSTPSALGWFTIPPNNQEICPRAAWG